MPTNPQGNHCANCGKELERMDVGVEALQWRHADGFFSCDGRRGHGDKYAEPAEAASD